MSKSSNLTLPSVQGRRTWVAIKMTALLPDAHALIALSSSITQSRTLAKDVAVPFPGSARIEDLDVILKTRPTGSHSALTPAEIAGVRELYDNLVRICTHAQERGVKIIVDAEYRYAVLVSFFFFWVFIYRSLLTLIAGTNLLLTLSPWRLCANLILWMRRKVEDRFNPLYMVHSKHISEGNNILLSTKKIR